MATLLEAPLAPTTVQPDSRLRLVPCLPLPSWASRTTNRPPPERGRSPSLPEALELGQAEGYAYPLAGPKKAGVPLFAVANPSIAPSWMAELASKKPLGCSGANYS